MKAVLNRYYYPDQTVGQLIVTETVRRSIVPRLTLAVLELPWRDNKRRISCIPEGKYRTVLRKMGNRFRYPHFHIRDVPGRDWVLIHRGNTLEHTAGCLLVGTRFQYLDADGTIDVIGSARALGDLLEIMPGEFTLTVTS